MLKCREWLSEHCYTVANGFQVFYSVAKMLLGDWLVVSYQYIKYIWL